MTPARVLHLVGSPTSEFFADLSQLYASGCLDAVADPARYEPHIAHVSPDGSWRFPTGLDAESVAAAPAVPLEDAVGEIRRLRPEAGVPQMFCRAGMTTYRSALELLGVPLVGNRADVMALGADKQRSRAVVQAAGVRVPDGVVLRRGDTFRPEFPVVVKPTDSDNSVAVTLAHDDRELRDALDLAWTESEEALIEQYVPLGREVRCAVVERGGSLQALPLEEYAVDSVTKPIRTAEDKLARTADGALGLVAKDADHAWIVDPDDPLTATVGEVALACHRAMGCRHHSLFDFRVDPAGRVFFLEAGLYCSFSPSSVVVMMAAAAGITVQDLFAEALDLAGR